MLAAFGIWLSWRSMELLPKYGPFAPTVALWTGVVDLGSGVVGGVKSAFASPPAYTCLKLDARMKAVNAGFRAKGLDLADADQATELLRRVNTQSVENQRAMWVHVLEALSKRDPNVPDSDLNGLHAEAMAFVDVGQDLTFPDYEARREELLLHIGHVGNSAYAQEVREGIRAGEAKAKAGPAGAVMAALVAGRAPERQCVGEINDDSTTQMVLTVVASAKERGVPVHEVLQVMQDGMKDQAAP